MEKNKLHSDYKVGMWVTMAIWLLFTICFMSIGAKAQEKLPSDFSSADSYFIYDVVINGAVGPERPASAFQSADNYYIYDAIFNSGGGGGGGTVTGFSFTNGTVLHGTVTNPNSTPNLSLTWQGTGAEYVTGNGTLATFPTLLSQFVNDVAFINTVQTDNSTITGDGVNVPLQWAGLNSDGTQFSGNGTPSQSLEWLGALTDGTTITGTGVSGSPLVATGTVGQVTGNSPTPNVAALPAAGIGASATIVGTGVGCQITLISGNISPTNGDQFNVTYQTPFPVGSIVSITGNDITSTVKIPQIYVTSNANGFTVGIVTIPFTVNTTYNFSFIIVGY